MKCEKCGCETDFAVLAELRWCVMKDGHALLLDKVSPAMRKRGLCVDCFERCAEVFKKEDE